MNRCFLMLLLFCCQFGLSQTTNDTVLLKSIDDFESFIIKVKDNFVDEINIEKVLNNTKYQTIKSLDPYSNFFSKEESLERNKTWKGISYAGIGAMLYKADSGVIIRSVKEGYGADLEGLKPGDIIYKIQGVNCLGNSLSQIVQLLKGAHNTSVIITVKRDQIFKTFKILRRNVVSQSISFSESLKQGLGLIKVDQFLRGSGNLFRENIKQLINQGAEKIIIDLRGNLGGIVGETVTALSAFLEKGTKVYELRSNDQKSNYIDSTRLNPISTQIPLVILVDSKTISSGEIFCGVLQDLDRAVLIGNNTFGKGMVQGTRYFKDGSSIYITAARYHLPSGRCIQKRNYFNNYNPTLNREYKKDSVFYSLNKRPFFGYSAVSPDIKLNFKNDELPIEKTLKKTNLIFDFSVKMNRKYKSSYLNNWETIQLEWKQFLLNNKEKITFEQDHILKNLKEITEHKKLKRKVSKMEDQWQKEKYKLLINSYLQTCYLIKEKLILFNQYSRGLYRFKAYNDPLVSHAEEILNDNEYQLILSTPK